MATPLSTPASSVVPLPTMSPIVQPVVPSKRAAEPPLTPAASVDENIPSLPGMSESSSAVPGNESGDTAQEPPKKKRRAALTRVGDLPL